MLLSLDDPDTLERRTRRPLLVAAALASAILAPLVDHMLLVSTLYEGAATLEDLLYGGIWAATLAAPLGAAAAHVALRRARSPWLVLATATLAGMLYLPLLLCTQLVPELLHASLGEAVRMLALPVLTFVIGSVISGPAGFVFGLVFATGLVPAHQELAQPSHASPARSAWAAAGLLLVTAMLAALLSGTLDDPYRSVLHLLGLPMASSLAWTRVLVVPAPLGVAAVAFAVHAAFLHRRLALTRRALVEASHPQWVLEQGAQGELDAVLPLSAGDVSARSVVRLRGRGNAYRGAGPALAKLL
ncbi:MAG: hypothetical protein K1X94_20530 [Sandaracinaceae bacterium]|nr:hypothetical protein [Sandaracinaceae bacterium]